MSRVHRRSIGTIFWGLILVIVGGLLLGRNLGYEIPIWSALARYWPVLIIAWGAIKLVEYFHRKRDADNRPLFSGGEVALLILVILAGTAITTAAHVSPNFDVFEIGDLDLWDVTGNSFTFEEHHEAAIPSGASVEIFNMFGTVEVRSSDSDRVILDVTKTIRASNRDEAERLSSAFMFTIDTNGPGVRIASSQDRRAAGRARGRQRFKSSLTVRVPNLSPVRVENRNGRVSIQDLSAHQTVTNRYGEVEVREVRGDVDVNNSFGAVNVRNVAGEIRLTGRFGAIRLDLDDAPQKDISVSMEFGDVRLSLPAEAAFDMEARTAFGNVNSDFGSLADEDRSDRERLRRGRVGSGGPRITLETRFGDVRVQKRG